MPEQYPGQRHGQRETWLEELSQQNLFWEGSGCAGARAEQSRPDASACLALRTGPSPSEGDPREGEHRQEPWELALLTKALYDNIANIGVPLFEDIIYGTPFKMSPGKKTEDVLLPTAETIEAERAYELKRLSEIELQKNAADQVQSLLKDKKICLRRPLPPKK